MFRIVVLVLSLIPTMVAGQPKSKLFNGLKYCYIGLNIVDVGLTLYNVSHGAKEVGPIGRFVIKNKPVALALKGVVVFGTVRVLDSWYQENKYVSTGVLLGLNLLYGSVVYDNFQVAIQLSLN